MQLKTQIENKYKQLVKVIGIKKSLFHITAMNIRQMVK